MSYANLRTAFQGMTKEHLHGLFDYRDGVLFWKNDSARRKIKAGDVAGSDTSQGYRRVTIGYKEIPLHRIVFCMHHGYVPEVIDHINGNPKDNRIENLREATPSTNQHNKKIGKNNTSGCKNVSLVKGRWQVAIRANKKRYWWYTDDFEFAELLAHEARLKYHGEFANHVR